MITRPSQQLPLDLTESFHFLLFSRLAKLRDSQERVEFFQLALCVSLQINLHKGQFISFSSSWLHAPGSIAWAWHPVCVSPVYHVVFFSHSFVDRKKISSSKAFQIILTSLYFLRSTISWSYVVVHKLVIRKNKFGVQKRNFFMRVSWLNLEILSQIFSL